MRVYLMQHGKPIPKDENPERPLSVEGKRDVNRMGGFLRQIGLKIDECVHSGKTRARETAEIMIAKLNPELEVKEIQGLSPLDDVQGALRYIKGHREGVMIVGHLPHLAKLSSSLVTGIESSPVVKFQQGGVLCLEKEGEGGWTIAWLLVPDLVGKISNP